MSHLQKIEALFTAHAAKNVAAARDVMAADITWSIPGRADQHQADLKPLPHRLQDSQ